MSDTVDCTIIEPGLAPGSSRIFIYNQLNSTNELAMKSLADLGHGDVVFTQMQTGGKGRNSRIWKSGEKGNAALSIVLDWPENSEQLPMAGQAAAIAIRNLLAAHGIEARLKWPNDVQAGNSKIAGILSESKSLKKKIVLGIGLNINLSQVESETWQLDQSVTSMRMETGEIYNPLVILRELLDNVSLCLRALEADGGAFIQQEWKKSDALTGWNIELRQSSGILQGRYAGLDQKGRLLLADESNEIKAFWSGDVERVRKS